MTWRNNDPRDDDSELEYWLIMSIPVIIMISVVSILIISLNGCSVKFCNCHTNEQQDKKVDRNSTNLEFRLTPSTQ